jgi:heme-degrading monooxygenase HmoA
MFIVIFEAQPKKDRFDQYLDIAKHLKPELQKVDGFIDNERFRSRQVEGKVLSLSTWRDEKAIVRWRTLRIHHEAQEKGRQEVFADYHLRVGEVFADSSAPTHQSLISERTDNTDVGKAKIATICELIPDRRDTTPDSDIASILRLPSGQKNQPVAHETFESITEPGKRALLATWKDERAATAWQPEAPAHFILRCRQIRIIRDYGMFDRREAPQYYPEV